MGLHKLKYPHPNYAAAARITATCLVPPAEVPGIGDGTLWARPEQGKDQLKHGRGSLKTLVFPHCHRPHRSTGCALWAKAAHTVPESWRHKPSPFRLSASPSTNIETNLSRDYSRKARNSSLWKRISAVSYGILYLHKNSWNGLWEIRTISIYF